VASDGPAATAFYLLTLGRSSDHIAHHGLWSVAIGQSTRQHPFAATLFGAEDDLGAEQSALRLKTMAGPHPVETHMVTR
jgi:hypothetical protein